MSDWIMITPRIEGNEQDGYHTSYYSDRVRHRSRGLAIKHGVSTGQSDDFLIGELMGRTLLSIWYLDTKRDDRNQLLTIAGDLGFLTE